MHIMELEVCKYRPIGTVFIKIAPKYLHSQQRDLWGKTCYRKPKSIKNMVDQCSLLYIKKGCHFHIIYFVSHKNNR